MIAYSEPIRKIASARLPFCSFMASRHIDLRKQSLSSELEQSALHKSAWLWISKKKRHITRGDVTKNKRCRLEKFT